MMLLQEENAAESEKDGRYNDALDHKRERKNAPQPTCVWLRFQPTQFFDHSRDDLDRSFDIGIRIKPAKRKTQTVSRTILIRVDRAKHVRSRAAASGN
jgi:hypothetical protein